ncbi:MAG: alkylhydroperoxidase-related (seleno)protein [Myxococcota bacterium]|jgi:hypothetical protein|nr:alkylhydroperoxidase-related (seleno)protein [Myxococcota bacterium]
MSSEEIYPDVEVPIRQEILEAQAAAVRHWAAPGTWWSSAERLAIVDEVRSARDAEALPPWTAPSQVEGLIPENHSLPAAAIDAIWRLTNHPGTLTRRWYDALVPDRLSAAHYVELVGVVAQVNLVDRFADALSADRPALPPVQSGETSQELPEGAGTNAHWVPTAPVVDPSWLPADAKADVPNVRKALSLVPAERAMQWALIDAHYVAGGALADNFGPQHWSLDRLQIELIGARTSALNECFY